MKDYGIIQGSAEQALPLVIGKDTVYVHTDIVKLPPDDEYGSELYEYREVQYDKDEYIKLMAETLEDSDKQLTDTQLALVEMFEMMLMGGI